VAQIPPETIQQVLAATNIEDLIGSYIPIKRAGSGFSALCPFHNEKSPSFSISPARQFFHCFGCGKSGDAISFVREYENLTFTDAVRKLAARSGIAVVEEESDPHADQARRSRGRLMDVLRESANFMHELLLKSPDAQHARDYLKSRGFGREMAERWTVGWMPDDLEVFKNWAREKKITGRELVDSGMVRLREDGNPRSGIYSGFRGRLMFSIRNEIGDVVGFSGRELRDGNNPGKKYVNTSETAVFKKSNILFGLDRAKKAILREKAALMCEGQIDVIACHEAGVDQAVATQGTALTGQHARMLRRYTPTVVLCYDGDNAGFAAAEKSFRILAAEGLAVRVVELPKGDDPDTYVKAHGAESFRERIANSREFFDFKLDRANADGSMASTNARAAMTNDCAELLALMSDAVMREAQIMHVATRLQVGISTLKEATGKETARAARQQLRRQSPTGAAEPEVIEPTPVDGTVAALCGLALESAEAQHFLSEQFETLHEAGDYLAGISLLEQILSGHPDPGQPAAVNTFLGTLPEADRLALNQLRHGSQRAHEDPMKAAHDTMSILAAKVLIQRDARIKSALNEPGIAPERLRALLEEGKEIQGMIKGIGARFLVEETLPPMPKKPVAKKEWKKRA